MELPELRGPLLRLGTEICAATTEATMSRSPQIIWVVGAMLLASRGALATTLTFDDVASGTPLSGEYAALGVVLSSTAPIGPGASSDPADSLQPGESVAPFVFAITAVPSTSTPSPPNKIIGAKYDVGGGLTQCDRCGIRITFLAPIPTEVSFWITDPDPGQSAQFFGPGGLLQTTTINPASSAYPEFLSFSDPSGVSEIVLISAPSVGIGFDSLTFTSPVPEPSAAALLLVGLLAFGAKSARPRTARSGKRMALEPLAGPAAGPHAGRLTELTGLRVKSRSLPRRGFWRKFGD